MFFKRGGEEGYLKHQENITGSLARLLVLGEIQIKHLK